MNSKGLKIAGAAVLLVAMECFGMSAYAQSQDAASPNTQDAALGDVSSDTPDTSPDGPAVNGSTQLGMPLVKNLLSDQKTIWESPFHLRWSDTNWLLPFAGATAVFIATDRSAMQGISSNPTSMKRYVNVSNYGLAALAGLDGGMYLWGRFSNDDHRRETGILAGEAAIDSLAVDTALKYAFSRERPYQNPNMPFFSGGDAFPSDHSIVAWSVASVFAHEYPGPLTQIMAYGLASAISASRVLGRQHSPSDVFIGAALGWLVGQHVYRAHHDPELGGGAWETLSERENENGGRNIKNAGSPYIPLDSWIYPALDRLIAMGYIHSAFQDVRPLTRVECASLVQEAGDNVAASQVTNHEAERLYTYLRQEFQSESAVLNGEGSERSIRLESVYTNVTDISGPPLNDSYHFGQTIIDNFGRPYAEGVNTYDGISGYATSGPYTIYVRGEFQHSPSAPALPLDARELIARVDQNPLQPGTPVSATDQFRLLDTYVSANVNGWDLSLGKQSLWWGRGVGGALMFSDNAEPIYMFRARPIEAFVLPWIFSWLGPVKTDFFFGKLSGNEFPARPLIHGIKFTAKRTQNLELSFVVTSELGGVGRPLTTAAILSSFFSASSSDLQSPSRNPGKRTLGADFTYTFPHLRNWLSFYANGLLPEANNTSVDNSQSPIYVWERSAIRSGIYMPRIPHIAKLDLRLESAYTDPPTPRSFQGDYIYWNDFYHDLYLNKGNLIGDWVGRQGVGFQGWTTYWFSSRNSLQFSYRHAKVDSNFIPAGETINDGSVKVNWQALSDLGVSASVQYEKWFAPILAPVAQTNWTSSVQIQFTPHSWGW